MRYSKTSEPHSISHSKPASAKMHPCVHLLGAVGVALTSQGGTAFAQEVSGGTQNDGGQWTLAPYVWASRMSGDVALGGINVAFDEKPGELVKNINIGGMGALRWQKDGFNVFAEGIYFEYEDAQSELFFNQYVHSELAYLSGSIGKTWKLSGDPDSMTATLSGGLSYTEIEGKVTGTLGNISLKNDWVQPVFGLLLEKPMGSGFDGIVKIDAGKKPNGDSSTFSAVALLNVELTSSASLGVGYRYAEGKLFGDDGYRLDTEAHGPLIAVSFYWQ